MSILSIQHVPCSEVTEIKPTILMPLLFSARFCCIVNIHLIPKQQARFEQTKLNAWSNRTLKRGQEREVNCMAPVKKTLYVLYFFCQPGSSNCSTAFNAAFMQYQCGCTVRVCVCAVVILGIYNSENLGIYKQIMFSFFTSSTCAFFSIVVLA